MIRISSNKEWVSVPKEIRDAFNAIYEASFPCEERRSLGSILVNIAEHQGELLLKVGEGLEYFIIYYTLPSFYFLEYLCVHPCLQSKGLGSIALSDLSFSLVDKPIVLECEPLNGEEMRKRRLGFYDRNGFTILTDQHVQPAYEMGGQDVPLLLLSNSENLSQELVLQELAEWYRASLSYRG